MFFALHWWVTARCSMLSSGGLPSNREIAHVCAGYASSFPAWKWLTMTYHDVPTESTRWREIETPEPIFWKCGILIITQCHWQKRVSMLVWIARALRPVASPCAHWRLSTCIDGFLGHQMANGNESVTCSPGSISQPTHLTLQTPSRSNGLIGEEKRLSQAPIVPNVKSQIKGLCQRSSLTHQD